MIFAGPKNFLCFVAGSISIGAGLSFLAKALIEVKPGYGVLAAFIFLAALFLYVQMFYNDKPGK
jgi:hypothetical protein